MESENSWVLRSNQEHAEVLRSASPAPARSPLPSRIQTNAGTFSIQLQRLEGGKADGLEALIVSTGDLTTCVLPDRGMGIWKCWAGSLECGWQSPVAGPVHPKWVPLDDASGIGWLEGFDELLVRCGLLSNGAPEFTDQGTVRYPLHGRIANLPAQHLSIQVDREHGYLDVVGVVTESRFLIYTLELQTRYRFRIGHPSIEIIDTVTNRSGVAGSMQLLYHINVGQPIVQSGSRVHTAYKTITPRDARALEGNATWDQCEGPASGYSEQVYFIVPQSNGQHWTEAMIANADRSNGLSVQFDTRTLPYLNLWKNTVSVDDGYVVGLEPATGFPNTRSVEDQGGRVIALEAGESKSFRLKLMPLTNTHEVHAASQRVASQQAQPGTLHDKAFHG
jgi:hypothetical protein